MKKKVIYILLLTFVILDISYSFYQHYHMPLDGDMSEIIMPTPEKGYYHVLQDPIGITALTGSERYANPNRFFAHWTASTYFLAMPLFLQNFVSPIESVYLSAAIAKTIMQLLILLILASAISQSRRIFSFDFVLAAAIISPFFQTAGYARYMGIIDPSVIYAFFYALPLGLLLLFLLPFWLKLYSGQALRFTFWQKFLLFFFAGFLSLNGPLGPGVVLILFPMVCLILWIKEIKMIRNTPILKKSILAFQHIPTDLLIFGIIICSFSLYSLYLGSFNALNFNETIPLSERYARIPQGLLILFTQKPGFPLMFIILIVNCILIRKFSFQNDGKKLLKFVAWTGVFALLYVLLLPLGGYRLYRENIIRYDTFLPITLAIVFITGLSSFYILKVMKGKAKTIYSSALILFLLLFMNADRPETKQYLCEKQALQNIADAKEQPIFIDSDCPIMEWNVVTDFRDSELNARLFYYWNITTEKKLYFQKQVSE